MTLIAWDTETQMLYCDTLANGECLNEVYKFREVYRYNSETEQVECAGLVAITGALLLLAPVCDAFAAGGIPAVDDLLSRRPNEGQVLVVLPNGHSFEFWAEGYWSLDQGAMDGPIKWFGTGEPVIRAMEGELAFVNPEGRGHHSRALIRSRFEMLARQRPEVVGGRLIQYDWRKREIVSVTRLTEVARALPDELVVPRWPIDASPEDVGATDDASRAAQNAADVVRRAREAAESASEYTANVTGVGVVPSGDLRDPPAPIELAKASHDERGSKLRGVKIKNLWLLIDTPVGKTYGVPIGAVLDARQRFFKTATGKNYLAEYKARCTQLGRNPAEPDADELIGWVVHYADHKELADHALVLDCDCRDQIARAAADWMAWAHHLRVGVDPRAEDTADQTESADPTSRALNDVQAERRRQREKWGDKHDDGHQRRELACAARGYLYAYVFAEHNPAYHDAADFQPFDRDRFLAKVRAISRRQRLVRAAALILAEIERIDRAERRAEQ